MRKITVLSMITLDGVIQGPGAPKEDASGGFKYGGWVAPYDDDMYGNIVQKELSQKCDYLLGKKTYQIWAAYWPKHGEFWPGINSGMKYVFSKKLKKTDKLVMGWENSTVIRTAADIRKLKNSKGPDIQVWGSGKLVQLLFKNDLVDELRLKIHPLMLGKGKNLFSDGVIPAAFRLVDSCVTTKGVFIATYERAGKVRTGSIGS
ncbi:MAG: dihydrofolate reductase family protein [Cyclobacteriaceae bacterium]